MEGDEPSPTTILVTVAFLFRHRHERLHQAEDGQRNLVSAEAGRALLIPGRVGVAPLDHCLKNDDHAVADLCFALPQSTGNLSCTELLQWLCHSLHPKPII